MDLRWIYLLQALRAFAYGFASVILGASLARSGLSAGQVGLVFASLLAGSAIASLGLARRADRLGRRRVYALLYALMAIAGAMFALSDSLLLLILAGLTGTLSVEVVESGPFTSVEQAMIPEVAGAGTTRAFGRYNAFAALLGAGGALLAGGPQALRGVFPSLPADQRWLLVYSVIGVVAVVLVRGLSPRVEAKNVQATSGRLDKSRRPMLILTGLFGLDSFAGGFIVQSFLVYWFTERYGASTGLMGVVLAEPRYGGGRSRWGRLIRIRWFGYVLGARALRCMRPGTCPWGSASGLGSCSAFSASKSAAHCSTSEVSGHVMI